MDHPEVKTTDAKALANVSGNLAHDDYTKTRWYIITDVALKVISAVAVVALGYAGFRLQRDSEAGRTAAAVRDEEERKYLPELRSISEVDVALLETSKEFDWATLTREEALHEARVGAHLTYMGDSLYFRDGEPHVTIVSAKDNVSRASKPAKISTSARLGVLFLGDFMRFAPLFQRWSTRPSRLLTASRRAARLCCT
jgi:hypothetical protein